MTVFGSGRYEGDGTTITIAYNTGVRVLVEAPVGASPDLLRRAALRMYARDTPMRYPWELYDRHIVTIPPLSAVKSKSPFVYLQAATTMRNGRVRYLFATEGRLGGCSIGDEWAFEMNKNPRRHLATLRSNLEEWLDERYGRRATEFEIVLPLTRDEAPVDDIDEEDFDVSTVRASRSARSGYDALLDDEIERRRAVRLLRSQQPTKRTPPVVVDDPVPWGRPPPPPVGETWPATTSSPMADLARWEKEIWGVMGPRGLFSMSRNLKIDDIKDTIDQMATLTIGTGPLPKSGEEPDPGTVISVSRIKEFASSDEPGMLDRNDPSMGAFVPLLSARTAEKTAPAAPPGYTAGDPVRPPEAPAVVRDPKYLRINAWMLDMQAILGLTVEETKEAFDIYPNFVDGTVVLRSKAGHIVARGTLPAGEAVPENELLEIYEEPIKVTPTPAVENLTVRSEKAVAASEDPDPVDPDARGELELY